MNNDFDDLTFEQREGLVPLPRQLELGQLDNAAKARLWAVVNALINGNKIETHYGDDLANNYLKLLAETYFVRVQHRLIDDFEPTIPKIKMSWRHRFRPEATYGETLGFVEWLVRTSGNDFLRSGVRKALIETRCAYRLLEDRIIPIASSEEASAVESALFGLQNKGHSGPRTHLLNAGSNLSQGKFADSVRESVHCVEGLVRGIVGDDSFGTAVAKIAKERGLHPALKAAIGNLYGYSSDEQGIRHPLLDKGDPNVTEQDAMFMLGICASFASYLANPA